MKAFLVSIIIPCYNAEKYLRQTLESVRWQSYRNWECILIDDGSTDSSAEIFYSFQSSDSRFRYLYQTNQGPSIARNTGVNQSVGEFIQFLDADDILLQNRLHECVEKFHANSTADIVYSDFVLYEKGQKFLRTLPAKIPNGDVVKAMLFDLNIHFVVLMHSMMFRRPMVEAHPFDTSLPYWAEDQDCWIRMAMDNAKFTFIDSILVIYRFTENNLTSKEAELISSKITMLERYSNDPRTKQFGLEFQLAFLYLRQRLVMGYFMEKSFKKAIQLLVSIWTKSTFSAKLKMAGWGILMFLFSKKFIVLSRAWIVEQTPFKWGGWKHAQMWSPPQSIIDLLRS